jgi:hypothetical protein
VTNTISRLTALRDAAVNRARDSFDRGGPLDYARECMALAHECERLIHLIDERM